MQAHGGVRKLSYTFELGMLYGPTPCDMTVTQHQTLFLLFGEGLARLGTTETRTRAGVSRYQGIIQIPDMKLNYDGMECICTYKKSLKEQVEGP